MQRSQALDLSARFADLLPLLLRDYATSTDADTPAGADGSNTGVFSRNIVWATQDYEDLGIHADQQITLDVLNANPGLITPRTTKARDAQAVRTKERAEIFTPAWLVNFQNDVVDHAWSTSLVMMRSWMRLPAYCVRSDQRFPRSTICLTERGKTTWIVGYLKSRVGRLRI